MGYRMPFGKWKGQDVSKVPDEALQHYLAWDSIYPETKRELEAEWERRAGRGPGAVRAHEAGPSHPEPDPDRVVPEGIRGCAFDLVNAGAQVLLQQHPTRSQVINRASELLRGWLRSSNDRAVKAVEDDEVPF